MKIQCTNKELKIKKIEFDSNRTTFYLDIKFKKGEKYYHIVEQSIDPDYEGSYYVSYDYLKFFADASDLSPTDISNVIVNYLADLKLYLYSYSIIKESTFVSYVSPKSESEKMKDLTYAPRYLNRCIYVEAIVQLEDDVNYYRSLDIRIKEPINTISEEEIDGLGYSIDDCGLSLFAIVDDAFAKKHITVR